MNDSGKIAETVLKIGLVAGAIGFFAYGISLFFAKPTMETITTQPRPANIRNRSAQDINFRSTNPRGR